MKTTVVNVRRNSSDIFVGRPSMFGNPFIIDVHGNREEVLEKFAPYFYERLASDDNFKKRVLALRGRVLGCYCKPPEGFNGRLLCHGQIIAGYLDNIPPSEAG